MDSLAARNYRPVVEELRRSMLQAAAAFLKACPGCPYTLDIRIVERKPPT